MPILWGGQRRGGYNHALAKAVEDAAVNEEDIMVVHKTCKMCGTSHFIQMTIKGYLAWTRGAMIQDAMPELTPDQRELLISGICSTCYDKILGD